MGIGDIGDNGGEFSIESYPIIETKFADLFLNLNYFFFNWDLWNIGESCGDNILISYLDLFDAYFCA